MSMMVSFVLSFFPRDVLDEILNLIESVSEDFPSYFNIVRDTKSRTKCASRYCFVCSTFQSKNHNIKIIVILFVINIGFNNRIRY